MNTPDPEYGSDAQMISNERLWPGETLCLKKRPTKPDEKVGVIGYSAFGVITNSRLPLIVYLQPNFITEKRYESIQDLLDDGWIVD